MMQRCWSVNLLSMPSCRVTPGSPNVSRRNTHHEIALDEGYFVGQTFASCMCSCPFDLVGIIVQAYDIASSECCNLSGRFANTTSDVENSHSFVDVDSMSKIMLVARKSLEKRLSDSESAKMERLCPSFFVQIGDKVIIAVQIVSQQEIAQQCSKNRTYLLTTEVYLRLRSSLAASLSSVFPSTSQWLTYSRVTVL
jgi:hypothetical protein